MLQHASCGQLGIQPADLVDAGLAILSFQDPDDINIELTAPLAD